MEYQPPLITEVRPQTQNAHNSDQLLEDFKNQFAKGELQAQEIRSFNQLMGVLQDYNLISYTQSVSLNNLDNPQTQWNKIRSTINKLIYDMIKIVPEFNNNKIAELLFTDVTRAMKAALENNLAANVGYVPIEKKIGKNTTMVFIIMVQKVNTVDGFRYDFYLLQPHAKKYLDNFQKNMGKSNLADNSLTQPFTASAPAVNQDGVQFQNGLQVLDKIAEEKPQNTQN